MVGSRIVRRPSGFREAKPTTAGGRPVHSFRMAVVRVRNRNLLQSRVTTITRAHGRSRKVQYFRSVRLYWCQRHVVSQHSADSDNSKAHRQTDRQTRFFSSLLRVFVSSVVSHGLRSSSSAGHRRNYQGMKGHGPPNFLVGGPISHWNPNFWQL